MKRVGKAVYFDYNATSFMSRATLVHMVDWCNRGNPSSGYASAKEVATEIAHTRQVLADTMHYRCAEDGVKGASMFGDSPDAPGDDMYRTIFTSGATESNATLVYMICRAYQANVGRPHIVVSAVEHKSLIDVAKLVDVDVTYVAPDKFGFIQVDAVRRAIQDNTALITVQHANNETGCINQIAEIGALAHSRNIPFHSDTVQTFGRLPINVVKDNLDAVSISFHKCAGPPGVGALVIRERLIVGWKLAAVIPGSQQGGLRGGTENYPGIAASGFALREYIKDRPAKNTRLSALKRRLIDQLISQSLACKTLREYRECGVNHRRATDVVFISTMEMSYLPNTLLLSVTRWRRSLEVCNVEIKKELEQDGFVVSIGSACNTANKMASHVMYAMQIEDNIRKGVLRVSLGDDNTEAEIDRFAKSVVAIVGKPTA